MKVGDEHNISTTCPFCNVTFDAATGLGDKAEPDREPAEGDVSLCMRCGEWMMYDANLPGSARKPTPEEYTEIGLSKSMQTLRAAWVHIVEEPEEPIVWLQLTDRVVDPGFLPMMISRRDRRPLREQLDTGYQHGGGWQPMDGWTFDPTDGSMHYPGDPPMPPLLAAPVRDETLIMYDHDFVAIIQRDGSFEIARMD